MDEDRLVSQLRDMFDKRNKMTLSEFSKFTPLFKHNEANSPEVALEGKSDAEITELMDLGVMWAQRISLYDPVEIQADDTGEVLVTLPPKLTRVTTLNDIPGVDTDKVINTFNNAFDRSEPGRDLASPQIAILRGILRYSDTVESMVATVSDVVDMAEAVVGEQAPTTIDVSSEQNPDEWK